MKFLLSAFAFAFILSCSKDNDETVKVDPITGLDFTITTNEENPLQVGVTPSATGAGSYKIYFDFVGAPETFETSDGTIVSYTYGDETATYTVKVVASNSNGADDVELTKEHTVTVVPDTVIIDFESMNPPYFTGSKLEGYIEVVSGGVGDNSTDVGKILNDGAAYTTANITNMNYIDLTGGDKTISIDFYQETDRTPKMMLKLEGNIIEGGYDIDKVVDNTGKENNKNNYFGENIDINHVINSIEYAWAFGGNKILYINDLENNKEIYMMDVKSKKIERLTNNKVDESNIVWSERYRSILFTSNAHNNSDIYQMKPDGSSQEIILSSKDNFSFLDW